MVKINVIYIRSILIFLFIIIISIYLFSTIANRHKTDSAEILVATQNIPFGTFIRPVMVVKTKFPTHLINSNEIMDLEEVSGLTTITSIPKGQPIVYTQFSPTEKAQAPVQSHNPKNYTLTVNENTKEGKLFKPGTIDSNFGKFNGIKSGPPINQFPFVKLNYLNAQPIKPFGYAENKTLMFTLTSTQADNLKILSGQHIQLFLKGANGDEVVEISPIKKDE